MQDLYKLHDLHSTGAHQILSEASLGKAYLREMKVKPWRQMQPDFPPEIIGHILSTYYGGRSEVHIRREPVQVLYCDFLSMYPTVCTLMGLWRFVIAQGMDYADTTAQTRQFLDDITSDQLQRQETWQSLCTIVQVLPQGEIFPVRAKYGDDAQYTIGANHFTSDSPLWYTLADCITAKLLIGRSPKILRAISFSPKEAQHGLRPVTIAGDAAYRVDPNEGDFFKQIINLRSEVKKELKAAPKDKKVVLDKQQLALKILANATSYGIFVELNVEEENQLQRMLCYGAGDAPFTIHHKKFESAGSYFHPLLATLITGAARLMLAITERLACDAGLDWAFCDTDSMALAKPSSMQVDDFYTTAENIAAWFTPLNPYADKAPLLKIEDYNHSSNGKTYEPLYCLAISSKRYVLYNLDQSGHPILRKVSAHGLGHLIAPYTEKDKAALEDVQPWQQDFWLAIILAALAGNPNQPNYQALRNIHAPAISRYGMTTPPLEKWFSTHNQGKEYRDRVRPFNFLLALQARQQLEALKPVAPFNKDHTKAVAQCFDRVTGKPVKKAQLKIYLEVLAQYHLHPESKFLNGDYLDSGKTQRRHIVANTIQHIGKEANKWEEQYFTGYDDEAQLEYGLCAEEKALMLESVREAITKHGGAAIAAVCGLSAPYVLKVTRQEVIPKDVTLIKLYNSLQSIRNLR